MTKAEAVSEFVQDVLPLVQRQHESDGRKDRVARWEAWNNFTDALCKAGRITTRQYENWVSPPICD